MREPRQLFICIASLKRRASTPKWQHTLASHVEPGMGDKPTANCTV
jgi:hypothetical protein